MDKSESLKKLEAWIHHVLTNITDTKIYWEENVRTGKKLGEFTYWDYHQGSFMGLTEGGYFATTDISHAGYIDPNNPDNSYFVSISPYFTEWGRINTAHQMMPLPKFMLADGVAVHQDRIRYPCGETWEKFPAIF